MGFLSKVGGWVNDVLGTTDAMNQQNQQQWAMWNAQNAYNTPAAQMERLKEAGLNPALVYGSGSVVGNASSMSASGASGASGAGSLLAAVAKSPYALAKMGQDLQLGQEQIDQVQANNAYIRAQTEKVGLESDVLTTLINNTPPGFDPTGNKGVFEKVVRGMYGVGKFVLDSSEKYGKDEPLPRLGRKYQGR